MKCTYDPFLIQKLKQLNPSDYFLQVLGTPAREIIKVHPLLFLCKIQAKAKKKIGARF